MKDRFPGDKGSPPTGASLSWYLVAPDDSNDLPARPIFIICKTAGNLRIIGENGSDEIVPMTVGMRLDARPSRVMATNTTGTYIAFW